MKILKTLLPILLLLFGLSAKSQIISSCVTGTISVSGDPSLELCLGDGLQDRIRFSTSPLATPVAYIVVDENDLIVYSGISNFIDFENLPEGNLRVFSVSFIGQFLGEIGDNYLDAQLGSVCFQLSQNFIAVTNLTPVGGMVATDTGATALSLCIDPDGNSTINVETDADFQPYLFVITDENNLILGTSADGAIDFAGADAGVCRVWGLAYLGEYLGETGDDLLITDLSSACFELSTNFVEVTRLSPDAGNLTFADGSTSFTSCSVLEPTGTVTLLSTNNPATDFTFVYVDNETGLVTAINNATTIELADLTTGSYTIYGLSYTGNLLVTVGTAFDPEQLSDECSDLADNSLTLIKRVLNADDVMLEDGSMTATVCVGDGVDDFLTFSNTYMGDDNFTYVITNEGNFVLGVSDDPTINFEGAGAGICRVWGLAYSGALLVEEGINIGPPTLLSDECFDLSDGFVLINRNGPQGGDITYADGSESFVNCSEGTPTGTITFAVTNNDPASDYAFVLVNDTDNTVAAISNGTTLDLMGLNAGLYTVYGIAYINDLGVMVGDAFDPATAGGNCFELADNTLALTIRIQDAGAVALEDGSDEITVCVGDGVADALTFTSTYAGDDNFVFVITDDNNTVLNLTTDPDVDFDGAEAGTCRVWGLVYSGNLTVAAGDNLNGQPLSDECFDLTNDFVTVNRDNPDGATIAYADGSDAFFSCTELPPTSGFVIFTNTSNDPSFNYAYLVVNDEDNTVALITQTPLLVPNLPEGSFTVYGVSFTGNLTIAAGDTYTGDNLSDTCFDLADNTLTLVKRIQNADDVTLADGSSETTVCVGDGIPNVLTFNSNYTGNDEFVFVVTDEGNFVLDTSVDGIIDFEGAGAGICRVWGLVYSGNLTLEPGDNLGGGQALSDECFDLSDGFAVVNRTGPNAGTISLEGGATEFVECSGLSGTLLNLIATDADPNLTYAYLVVDVETDLIVAIEMDSDLDLGDLGTGSFEVYGMSYLENLTVNVGDVFTGAMLADECFDLSDNTISITNRDVSVSEITFENGETVAAICPDDMVADVLGFLTDYTGDDNLAFVITDTENVILEILAGSSTDFEDYTGDFVRVYAIAFSGNFLLQTDLDLDDNPIVSDDCYDLSNNFLLVDLRGPEAGELSLSNGEISTSVCVADGISDVLQVQNTAPAGSSYVYLITDENNIILDISNTPQIDFENTPAGVCRIWGLAYVGNLQANIGDNAATATLASECFDLSDNFITVTRTFVDGATVSLEDGTTLTFACSNDGEADFFIFTNTSSATDANYGYIVTNAQGGILAVLAGNSIDLDQAAPGQCRIYGYSYSGVATAQTGQNIEEADLSDGCFELSSNFITVQRDEVDGGMVMLSGGGTSINICPDDGVEDFLTFTNNGSSTAAYTYILTDVNNNVLSNIGMTAVDFSAIAVPAEVRVWGVAFSGLLTMPNGDIEDSPLSNRCYDLSDNFVTIIREQPVAGDVTTTEGETDLFLCTDDGLSDLYAFLASGASNTDYAFLITDDNNTILEILVGTNEADFEGVANGVCRVWGVAYTGNLTAQIGEDAAAIALSDDCFDLSSSFVTITRGELNAGTVITPAGDIDRFTCPGDGNPDEITFINQGAGSGTFVFVLTDADNIIVEILTGDSYDFETAAEGEYRMHGLVYTGDLLAGVGSDAGTDELATGCFDLSDNFITIFNITPAAGAVFTEDGETEIMICIGDGIPDPFSVEVFGASDANYTFLVVDEDNFLVGILNDPTFDFEQSAPGDWRIYGLSYTGALSVLPGANILEDELSSGCSDLTNTFIFVDKTQVDGGEVFTDAGSQVVYACPDGIADVVSFVNSGTSMEADYGYVLTTQTNIVLQVLTGNSVDLEDAAGLNQLRLWGVSYTGDLLLSIGNVLTDVEVSDGCNDISNSFVDIFIGNPEGGVLSFADGTDTTRLCHSNSMPGIQVNTSSTANVGYAYIVTDQMNNVLQVSEPADGVVNFDNLTPGTYHIWAVSYTGTLLVEVGDLVTDVDLATSCFDLSDNFVVLERTESLDAGNVSTEDGEEIVYICPQDGMADIVILDNDTDDPNYRYIITDDENNILFGDIESNIIDFDPSAPGICRVYGVVYTGEFNPQFMADITTSALSTDCWAISNNYITLVRQTPEGGIVTDEEGSIDVELVVDDGEADVVTFINTGVPVTTYAYVVTDEDNVILGLSTDGMIDFEGVPAGVCRVWGLSYTGDIIAMIGDDADEVPLTDDCFDLSDNFVTVTRIELDGFTPETTAEVARSTNEEVLLRLYPNPANDVLNVQVDVPATLLTDQQTVSCYDLNGMLLFQQPLAATGSQLRSLDISQLQAGIYLLRWYDGSQIVTKRFVKE